MADSIREAVSLDHGPAWIREQAELAGKESERKPDDREVDRWEEIRLSMVRWLLAQEFEVFATLTFAPLQRYELAVDARSRPCVKRVYEWCRPSCAGRDSRGRCATHQRPVRAIAFTQRVVNRFWVRMNERFFGRYWRRRGRQVRMFVPWEKQKWGALHAHPLIGGLPMEGEEGEPNWRFREIHRAWELAALDFGLAKPHAWLSPCESAGCVGYVAKYCTKDLDGDLWDLIGFCGKAQEGSCEP